MRLLTRSVLAAALACWAAVACAQSGRPEIHPWTRNAVANWINLGVTHILGNTRPLFDMAAAGEDAVTNETLARARLEALAAQRVLVLWFVYFLDHDGDGMIDRQELDGASTGAMLRLPSDIIDDLRRADRNDDGRLDITEIIAFAQRMVDQRRSAFFSQRETGRDFVPLALDRDGDGRVTRVEFETAIREAFAAFDTNGDGRLDRAEVAAARRGAP